MQAQVISRKALAEGLGKHPATPLAWAHKASFPDFIAIGEINGRTRQYPADQVYQWLLDTYRATPSQIRDLQTLEVQA